MKNRIMAALLVLCFVLGLLPATAQAAGTKSETFAQPAVTSLTVTTPEAGTVELLGNQTSVSLSSGSKPVFAAVLDSTDQLDKIYITSTKGGDIKYLEAKLQNGKYVTDGYFDPDNPDYIPGAISVAYSKKGVLVTTSNKIGGIDLEKMRDQLKEQGISLVNEALGDGGKDAEVTIKMALGMEEVFVDAAISEFTGNNQDKLDKWLGAYSDLSKLDSYDLKDENGNAYTLFMYYIGEKLDSIDENDPEGNFLMILRDISGSKYTKMLIKGDDIALDEVASTLAGVNVAASTIYKYYAISQEMDDLREEIAASATMTAAQKAEANDKIEALEKDKKCFMLGMTFIPMLVGATVITGGAAMAAAPALLFSALLGGISATSSYFWEHRIGMIKGCEPVENVFEDDGDHPGWTELTSDYLADHRCNLPESGYYYGATPTTGLINVPEGVHATLCLHGSTFLYSVNVRDGATLRIQDCTYKENADHTVTGGVITNGVTLGQRSEVIIDGGIIKQQYGYAITSTGGKLVINNGFIDGSSVCRGGDVIINGGIIKNKHVDFGTGIYAEGGCKLTINGGTMLGKTSVSPLSDNHGAAIIEVNGGELGGSVYTPSGQIIIRHGTVGGSVGTDAKGKITVHGCTYIEHISSHGQATINGGTIGRIYTNNVTYINGGTITKGLSTGSNGQTIITNGTIYGGIDDNEAEKTILLIGANSNITVSGTPAFDRLPKVSAAEGYSGGVTYYSSANAAGIRKTIAETAEINYTAIPYIHLVSDNISGDPNNPPAECEHTYTASVTAPTCTERGYTTYTCGKCGDTRTDDYTDALGHSYSEWVVTKDATATAEGERERTCTVCGDKATERIPATGGTPENPPSMSASDIEINGIKADSASNNRFTLTLPSGSSLPAVNDIKITLAEGSAITSAPASVDGGRTWTFTVTDKNGKAVACTLVITVADTPEHTHTWKTEWTSDETHHWHECSTSECPIKENSSKSEYGEHTYDKENETVCSACEYKRAVNPALEEAETNYILISDITNGDIIPTVRYASQGELVTLTAHPSLGYDLDKLSVRDLRGRELTLRESGGNRYSFIMPDTRVTVAAQFTKEPTADTDSDTSAPVEDEPFTGLGTPGISGIVLNPSPMPFTDVRTGAWYYDSVDYVWKHYLMSGVSDTQFAPNTTTSRAMIWTVLARMKNVRTEVNPGTNWYERGMLWAMEQGITDGTNPMGEITREQLATMLWRNAGSPGVTTDLSRFSDSGSVSNYAKSAVNWAVSNGILNGSNGKLEPQGTATRAQVAAMVMRYGERIGA